MEENKNKIDEVEKLSETDLDEVAGGTFNENTELNMSLYQSPILKEHGWNEYNIPFYSFARILSDVGIEARTSEGFLGGGSVNNVYRDMKTRQFLLQKEVIDYLKPARKSGSRKNNFD